ncbi:Hypothetical protein I5071_25440 [Sandaracinus amylolyticus]|nr:Hypothetical protein I5071_25440 [Sandaracinus amylolyticus]
MSSTATTESASSAPTPVTASVPPAPEPSFARRVLPKLGISFALAGLFVWLLERGGMPLIPSADAFARVRWWTVPAYMALLLVTHFFRASRWRFLITPVKNVPFREVIVLNWIGFFAIFALPLRLGEMARPALTKMRQGVPISAGFGTVAVERVIDGLVTSLCVVWALVALPHRDVDDPIARSLPYYGGLAVSVFAAAMIGLVLFLWQRALAVRLVDWTFGLVSKRLASKVAEKVASVADGVRSIAVPSLAAGFVIETLVYWFVNALGMWLLGWGCGLDMGFGHAVAVMGILAIGILLPAGPGLFGNFQLAISVALKLFFAESIVGAEGAVYVFLMYVTQAVMMTLTGVLPLYALKLRFSDLLTARA